MKRPRLKRRTTTQAIPLRLRGSNRDRVMITPEGIAMPVTLASRGSRAGALLLDLLFIVLAIIATTLALIGIAGGTFSVFDKAPDNTVLGRALQFLFILWVAAMFLLRNAYFLWFELGPRGATPGKRIVGVRIAARDGGRLTAEMVIARNLLRDIELFLPAVLIASMGSEDSGPVGLFAALWFLIFALMPLFNRDRLRAGDIVAGSWVVEAPRRRLEPVLSAAAAAAPGEAERPRVAFTDAELAVYGEYELQTLERVLREGRPEALAAVQETIAGKIDRRPLPADEPEAIRAFLDAYYAQLRARLEGGLRMGNRKADKFG